MPNKIIITTEDMVLKVKLCKDWTLTKGIPSLHKVKKALGTADTIKELELDCSDLGKWDSILPAWILKLMSLCEKQNISVNTTDLPAGASRLINLATSVPPNKDASSRNSYNFYDSLHKRVTSFLSLLTFLGETAVAFGKMLIGKARYQISDILTVMYNCGPDAFGIVCLISFLVGLILAFVGAIQLRMFGAEIYVADLVGIGMVREMGAIMTGVVMAGRTGAAFAAGIGTMQVNEEVDAFKTMGIDPVEFLVLPRITGLVLMMPVLCLVADFMGVLGGLVVGIFMLDIHPSLYLYETEIAIRMSDLFVGLFMSIVFGILISICGCLKGMHCGRSSAAVGKAATEAVVTSIISLVVATAIITVLCDMLGI